MMLLKEKKAIQKKLTQLNVEFPLDATLETLNKLLERANQRIQLEKEKETKKKHLMQTLKNLGIDFSKNETFEELEKRLKDALELNIRKKELQDQLTELSIAFSETDTLEMLSEKLVAAQRAQAQINHEEPVVIPPPQPIEEKIIKKPEPSIPENEVEAIPVIIYERCQLCNQPAPFKDKQGVPYLELHHILPLPEKKDSKENNAFLCPNCHRKMHVLNLESDIISLKHKVMHQVINP
ncbi:MAG: HNH endonuclease [Desulfobacterales bacterium]|nr:HNH endonuclease [Desulfobacterales bacterium]